MVLNKFFSDPFEFHPFYSTGLNNLESEKLINYASDSRIRKLLDVFVL